jgi:hypothetical protein
MEPRQPDHQIIAAEVIVKGDTTIRGPAEQVTGAHLGRREPTAQE